MRIKFKDIAFKIFQDEFSTPEFCSIVLSEFRGFRRKDNTYFEKSIDPKNDIELSKQCLDKRKEFYFA